ncbi:MAG: hypothetical protein Q8S35_03035, partial [bacterium]|nr:hypothetical protein [bacterium]
MAHKLHEGTSLGTEQPAVTPLSFGERMWIEGPMWGLPALIFCVIGAILGHAGDAMFGGAVAGVILWTTALVAVGIRINGEQDFVVVERLGRLLRVQPRGIYILWLPGLVDKIKCRDTFMAKEVPLYVGENNLIDFTDGSTRVISSAWYHIANPV